MTPDQRLRELERRAQQGEPDAGWQLARERYKLDQLRAGADAGAYVDGLDRARELEGFTFLGVERYECGGQTNHMARFEHAPTGLVFCLIPGGTFLMGSPGDDEEADDPERPQREVQVPAFLLAQTPCTQAAYERVTGETPSRFAGEPRRPVERVSWNDAQAFCAEAGALRLPSEAEWEYACRAGTQTRFCFGDDDAQLGRYAWFTENANETTHPVGEKLPNAFGLHDMHGNVEEWCQDTSHDDSDYQGAPTNGSAHEEAGASRRVVRGGSSFDEAWVCRAAFRFGFEPGLRFLALGFRPARSLP